MQLSTIQFQGHFEEDPEGRRETLNLVVPENELEEELLSWAILPLPQNVQADRARPGYAFTYSLGHYLGNGMYTLRIDCRDPSGTSLSAELAAGVVISATTPARNRSRGFTPFWFLKKGLHFRASHPSISEAYGGASFGMLRFGSSESLPHRRLFIVPAPAGSTA
jgi:hypothetical protein